MSKTLAEKYKALKGLLHYSLYCFCAAILQKHKAFSTHDKKLADKCKNAGFMVVLDFDGKSFVVAEV